MIVTLLTDYGLAGDHVGACHGVIHQVAPEARIIDVTHGIPRFDVRAGALSLRDTLPYLPVGVHVGVVDPGVGGDRRAVALRCADGRTLVGPDNGLLSLAWQVAGGVEHAVEISRSPLRLQPVSATFHGRDVFAPVAAALAGGRRLADAGSEIDPASLRTLTMPRANVTGATVTAHVLTIDHYGNVALDAEEAQLEQADIALGAQLTVRIGDRVAGALRTRTFSDVDAGALLLHTDAYGSVALARNLGDAARMLAAAADDEVELSRA